MFTKVKSTIECKCKVLLNEVVITNVKFLLSLSSCRQVFVVVVDVKLSLLSSSCRRFCQVVVVVVQLSLSSSCRCCCQFVVVVVFKLSNSQLLPLN